MAAKKPVLTALIVDDDPLMRWALHESLVDAGYDVQQAGTARQALVAVAESAQPFDVVLLDYMLPDSSDFGLLESLRRISPTSQVVMISSYATPSLIESAIKAGAHSMMSKPFEIDAVKAALTRSR